jgi:hypothetical protein
MRAGRMDVEARGAIERGGAQEAGGDQLVEVGAGQKHETAAFSLSLSLSLSLCLFPNLSVSKSQRGWGAAAEPLSDGGAEHRPACDPSFDFAMTAMIKSQPALCIFGVGRVCFEQVPGIACARYWIQRGKFLCYRGMDGPNCM